MKQKQFAPMSVANMALSLFAVEKGYIDDVELKNVVTFEKDLQEFVSSNFSDFLQNINKTCTYNQEIEAEFDEILKKFKKSQS
jgi:F-type H+-transporting ATPase subunit alpha